MNSQTVEKIIVEIRQKVDTCIPIFQDKYPHVTDENGKYEMTLPDWWTSGFWPGMLWIMYDLTKDEKYKDAAWDYDAEIERWFIRETEELHHDVGFQFLPTAVLKYKLTGDKDAKRRGLEAANFLAARFNPVGKFIRSWNKDPQGNEIPGWSIIDCMLNIPLLYWAAEVTGDPRYAHVATMHAETAQTYSIRADGSVNHIISIDPLTGEYIESLGGQGYSPESAWSRGAAWALYGFAQAYRYTNHLPFLDTAKRVANYFIACLPEDDVPYWDFRIPTTENEPRDSSAGAIAASGFIELANLVSKNEQQIYHNIAERIVHSLAENYATWDQESHEGILIEATGNRPRNHGVNRSFIFGDYYFLEACAKLSGWQTRVF